jgi:DNA-binding MarR family transcriptional regulator
MSLPDARPGVDRHAVAHEILDLLPRMRRHFERSMPHELRDEMAGVTVHQLEALCHLRASGGLTMHELAEKQSIGLSSATALADRLLRQGLAQRTSDPADRRVVRLVPTEAACDLVHRFVAVKRRVALHALDALDDTELLELQRLLDKIAEANAAEDARG